MGVPVLLFSTPLRRECQKNLFPENYQGILQHLTFVPSMRASLFLATFKSVISTQRGDHIFLMNFREVNFEDAEMLKFRWKQSKIALSVTQIKVLVAYNSEQAQWNDDSVAKLHNRVHNHNRTFGGPIPQPEAQQIDRVFAF